MEATIKASTAGATKEGLAACAVLFEARTGIRIVSHTSHAAICANRNHWYGHAVK